MGGWGGEGICGVSGCLFKRVVNCESGDEGER